MWLGDQNVDWSEGDGLPSVVPSALSSGLCGIGMTHIDIGLYTTFGALGLKRSAELLLRSAEMAVFSPVMRTHEGTSCENYPSHDTALHLSSISFTASITRPITRFKETTPVSVTKV